MYRFFTSILMMLLCCAVNAQECGFEKAHERLLKQDPNYKFQVEKMKLEWARFNKLKSEQRLVINGTDTVYEIPVVVHIIHTGGPIGSPYNPTDASIQASIDFTNQCYSATVPGYPNTTNGGHYIPFKFVLAKRDPNCMPTSGILRVDGTVLPDYASDGIEYSGVGAPETDVKALSKWPNDEYYNIWVVNKIGNGSGIAGYAYYPGAGPAVDGCVILASSMVSGQSTLAHEIGHGMNLPHTFEGDGGGGTCPPNIDCNVDGDGICDTEPHDRNVGCAAIINPCTGTNINFTQHSFMSYSHGCRERFTAGQGDRAIFALKNSRTSLMNSIGGIAPPPAPVAPVCTPNILNPGSSLNAGPTEVHFSTINHFSGGFTTEGHQVFVDNFCTGYTEVFTGDTYDITVKTGNLTENVRVFLDYDNNGQFDPVTELIFSSNSAGSQTHTGTVTIPGTSVICQPLRMRVMSDVATAPAPAPCADLYHGQGEDYTVTVKPPTGATIDNTITQGSNPGCVDSLIEFTAATTNVPTGNTIIWKVNNQNVATGQTFSSSTLQDGDVVMSVTVVTNTTCLTPDSIRSAPIVISHMAGPAPTSISFIDGVLIASTTPVQWFGPSGPIPGATNQNYTPTQPGVYFAVVTSSGCPSVPSNLLLISLLSVGQYDLDKVKIYPNPAHETITLDWGNQPADGQISIYNTLGQQMASERIEHATKKTMNLGSLTNGIYFLSIKDKDGKAGVVKITVQH